MILALAVPCIAYGQIHNKTADITGEDAEDSGGFSETVTVTATRVPVTLGESGRHVEVLTADEIEAHGVRAVPELLQLLPGVDVRRRGVSGMQADLSVRGSSFEQVLVMIDGVPVSNPQTGHHNLDIPIPVASIERVEILYGPGSAVHGANASGGVVNILTKKTARSAANLEIYAGENSLAGSAVGVSFNGARSGSHIISVERAESDGYLPGTEFDESKGWYRGTIGPFGMEAGASERDFGALNFYTTRFPNQLEFTRARFMSLSWSERVGGSTLTARAGVRSHSDRFILDRQNPALMTNIHNDDTIDLQITIDRSTKVGEIQVGFNRVDESLDSSNLGNRDRDRLRVFSSLAGGEKRYRWRTALSTDIIDDDWEIHPVIAVSTDAGPGKLRASVAGAYRLPTFTELHYVSPATVGNPDLAPEHTWSYEVGYDLVRTNHRTSLTAFRREGRDLIDFVMAPDDTLFRAVNLRRVDTTGFEVTSSHRITLPAGRSGLSITAGYTVLNARGDEPEGMSAYVFDYMKQRAIFRAQAWGDRSLRWGATASLNERNGGDRYPRLDARVGRSFQRGRFELFIQGSNLTDERYFERGDVEMPGRWLVAGFRLSRPFPTGPSTGSRGRIPSGSTCTAPGSCGSNPGGNPQPDRTPPPRRSR